MFFHARLSNPGSRSSRLVTAVSLVLAGVLMIGLPGHTLAQDHERPADWNVRFDNPEASEDQLEMFVTMPPGWHVTSGPAGIYWGPEMEAEGEFRLEMEVFLFDPGRRREAFGIFFGGRELMADAIEYSYFLIRNGSQFIVKRREGSEYPTILGWPGHEAILVYNQDEGGSEKNVLAVEAGTETVHFFVNDAEVASLPRSEVAADGTFGFRVNHGLNLHITRVDLTSR